MADGLILNDVALSKAGETLLRLTATIPKGDVLTVMGPSGSGKSSLLAYLMGDLAPVFEATGQVVLNGRDVTGLAPQDRQIGILYQDPLLFPHLSVASNLAFGLPRGGTRRARQSQVEAALADIALEGFGPRDPATLSGGQAARVALMRVLLSSPRALLLDEPFSKLDSGLRDQMRTLVFDRARQAGIPVLLVTHDAADAEAAGGQIVKL